MEIFERSLETFERLGDAHGMAQTWGDIASVYLDINRAEEAKPLLARAYSVFARMGSPDAGVAF